MNNYWNKRKEFKYYKKIIEILNSYGEKESILDIGCYNTPIVTFGNFKKRISIDKVDRPDLPNVEKIIGSFPECIYNINYSSFSVIICLQTIEHLNEPKPFIKKIFDLCEEYVILSLPWKWKPGIEKSHKQDLIGYEKIYSWTDRDYTSSYIIKDELERCILEYKI